MLHHYGIIALDLARERSRELEREATRRRLMTSLRSGTASRGPGRMRGLVARPLRALSTASHAVSDVACAAATRLEGRSV
jgi:hypothetical protein